MPKHHYFRGVTCALLAGLLAAIPLQAQDRKLNPTSKLYVADVTGTAQISDRIKVEDLSERSVYNANETVIETKEDSTNILVWSNGTGTYFAPNTRLEVNRFIQEPFTPNRTDMEVEPSISRTESYLPRGTLGICTSKLVAGSTMTYTTPHASLQFKGRKAVIEVTPEGTKISLLEGDMTVHSSDRAGGHQLLQQGQQAIVKPDGTITIQPIPKEEIPALDDMVSLACNARKMVYFDSKGRDASPGQDTAFGDTGATTDEIQAVEVIQPSLSPVITVSPAAIPQPQ